MTPPFRCLWCDEMIEPGDLRHSVLPDYHYACALRTALGSLAHLRGECSCFVAGSVEDDPPGLTKRQAARLVADYLHQQPGRN